MSKLKEVIGYNQEMKKILKFINLEQLDLPPLDELYELALLDHNDKRYVLRILKQDSQTSDGLNDIACESLSIDLNDIKEMFVKLTDDQRDIVMHIYFLYKELDSKNNSNELDENPRIILQGPAGTGKSFIINLIEKLITWEENKTSDSPQNLKVIKCAFTGKAASNIEGFTLNHTFSIPIYKHTRLSKKRLEVKQEMFKECLFFICDEISMVGEKTMKVVNSRLQQIFNNDKMYGNRFVLLVGDLYQIDPVKQLPVYPNTKFWTCCEFYELTKIMRQQDSNFITALNNFRDSKMTQEDVELLRSRMVEDYDQVPDSAIHLFYQNKYVDEYNNNILNKSNEKEEVINAIEDCDSWEPSQLRIKVGIRYMITYNLDVGDGLANGTTGIVRDFDYDKHGGVSAVWMEFHSDSIGKKTRSEYLRKHNKTGVNNWVPIPRSKIVVKLKTNPKVNKTIGNMFPLKAAEAITIHKSQGQTYHDGVCIHFTKDAYDRLRSDKSLQYVALTRVTRLENLYIMGNLELSAVNSKKFSRTEQELNRLRNEKKVKLAFETFQDTVGDVIIFLNTGGTFNEHYQFITSDKWYSNASLLIFTETNTISSDEVDIPGFEIPFHSNDDKTLRTGAGIICYKKKGKSLKIVSSISDDENKMYLALFLYENCIYILSGVKGDLNSDDFGGAIKKLITKYVKGGKGIFFIGGLNIHEPSSMIDVFKDMNIKKEMLIDVPITTKKSQHYSEVLTCNLNIDQDQMGYYQYIPSPHKPIYVKLPPIAELLKSYGASKSFDSPQTDDESQAMDSESQYENSETYSAERSSQSGKSQCSKTQSVVSNSQSVIFATIFLRML